MVPGKGKLLTQEISDAGEYAPLMMFDCRGYEPDGFVFSGVWKAESVSLRLNLSFHFSSLLLM